MQNDWAPKIKNGHIPLKAVVTAVVNCFYGGRALTGRLKMREWKMRYGQNSKGEGGKCGSGKSMTR